MAGYPHPQNLICENLDLTASCKIYMPQKFPGIRYTVPFKNNAILAYRKQQKFRGTKLLRFPRIFDKTQKFSLLTLGYGTS